MWLCAASDSASCKYKRALFLRGCFFSSSLATAVANMINSSFVHRYQKMKRCPDSPRTVLEQALDFMSQRLFFKKLFYPNFCPNCKQDGISVPPAPIRYTRKAAGVRGASSPSRPARLSWRRIRPEAAGRVQHTQREPRHVWTDTTLSFSSRICAYMIYI